MAGIGAMRMRATWQQRTRVPLPGAGGESVWTDIQAVWCDISPVRNARDEEGLQVVQKDEVVMKQRYWEGFTPTKNMRLLYEGRVYTPIRIQEVQERQRYWRIELQNTD